ncbi:bifunctional [glutamate--ammonia ligase]-adenylyl-L-tyrosine phosphorylase/[glutamate--ammonia-ligase] adenylyltransferase [Pokkaliibacter sp. MBI-7]|uniref:bifunctional [glutamate--ammonia ligase]-adenylyl-L-tyrosine phosphorylase/[glutamate--ammonia-ligase] adenylyltransferase n=1 Tax=Pokkaliibacter sp. MBI-7 TaxID=3040600 RepID=UPI00244C32C8|nr:bifunctional [glutamate--ammonia ligase]-adenylyl-L-tyrosine phosphorylase/[glutamate--ammonia-ligase] adenylyltransferase [Pokkaliibacter sp. MBI-7]MDH2432253.1 bifunctional [glutamate--ammonia ligase]-adenylyl-L-tyrosine phosphorylase/[glutamate--ammonia-ligase] adenylyltransferase [Pokkaliibacter sp. MBI-7]
MGTLIPATRYSPPTASLPTELAELLQLQLARLAESPFWTPAQCEQLLQASPADHPAWCQVALGSDYVVDQWRRHPDWLFCQLQDQTLTSVDIWSEELQALVSTAGDEQALQKSLRLFRHRAMTDIIWKDLNRIYSTQQTTAVLSLLADSCIQAAIDWHYPRLCERFGVPAGRESGRPQQLVVLGMGKLGAEELNLSSDIDLIFAFEEKGDTQGGKRELSNEEFFVKLGQKVIQALDQQTVDGFVFRVDMRLRPYGTAGTLAPSFLAMETYYQEQGRDWERYAMIKARVVAGDKQAGERLLDSLRPFVYRRYLDYSAFESLRSMKQMINREVRRKGVEHNVKLGRGGIREVEFIAQAFQLIRGGRDKRLQQRELLAILPLLPEAVGMPRAVVDLLTKAYLFLRDTEHAIQAQADQQTQLLPDDGLLRQRLAWVMGCESWASFSVLLESHRQQVRHHFDQVITDVEEENNEADSGGEAWIGCWDAEEGDEVSTAWLQEQGFTAPERVFKAIAHLKLSKGYQVMQPMGRERLVALVPLLMPLVARQPEPEQTLERVLLLVEAVLRRTAYLLLLSENPQALEQLVRLCAASSWFAEHLSRYPVLLDELIDTRALYKPMDKQHLRDELNQLMLRIPEQDTEQLMETLRYFKHAQVLRTAAADITGVLPLMKVSDSLTWLAEVILERVLQMCWQALVDRHGRPRREDGEPCDPDFIIVGYGKLGGIELSYGSDLDLVFVHDASVNGETEGPDKPVANQVFFTRLGQKIIHSLTTFTPSGTLYEVDMRLRPSGASGLLVSSLKAFVSYQDNEAWTWEQQALVRARVVAGCPRLAHRFEQARVNCLARVRELPALRQDVLQMRQKMRESLGSGTGGEEQAFHLKQDQGGIVDIEFLVQFMALAYAERYPQLVQYSDNIRILDAAEQVALLSEPEAETLREAYKTYRAAGHRLTLQNQSGVVTDGQLDQLREAVSALWEKLVVAGM